MSPPSTPSKKKKNITRDLLDHSRWTEVRVHPFGSREKGQRARIVDGDRGVCAREDDSFLAYRRETDCKLFSIVTVKILPEKIYVISFNNLLRFNVK